MKCHKVSYCHSYIHCKQYVSIICLMLECRSMSVGYIPSLSFNLIHWTLQQRLMLRLHSVYIPTSHQRMLSIDLMNHSPVVQYRLRICRHTCRMVMSIVEFIWVIKFFKPFLSCQVPWNHIELSILDNTFALPLTVQYVLL